MMSIIIKAATQGLSEGPMLAGIVQRRLAERGIYYGWVVVAAAFIVSVSTAGVMGLPGALMLPLEREFGWSATTSPTRWRSAFCSMA